LIATPSALPPRSTFPLVLLVAVGLGIWLRLDQLAMQVLLDDEWHPVHQVVYYTPSHVLTSFGNADYSIPLVLFYFLEHRLVGLTELGIRLPLVVAGVATVAILPAIVHRRIGAREASLFAILLAISPILVSYSRIARSYALTLLGVYLAFWCLEKALERKTWRWSWACGYSFLCALVVWTHAITGPVLIAPLAILFWEARRGAWFKPARVIQLAVITGACMAMAVLPPLLGDPEALAGKGGVDQITLQTLVGAWFLWLGTGSVFVAWVAGVLAILGCRRVLASIAIARWVVVGEIFTVVALVIARPWWVDRPLAFARYLLPLTPVILLCISAGLAVCVAGAARLFRLPGTWSQRIQVVGALALVVALWLTGPFDEILRYPNSYTQHSYFQYDYRRDVNPVRLGQATFPASRFWGTLASRPPGSITVAVAPFRYSTYEWLGPPWEIESRQRVIPAFVWGTCERSRHGEVPPKSGFNLRNAVHLVDAWSGFHQRVDYLAYYRGPKWNNVSPPMPHCEAWMREHLGPPAYEDDALVVWQNPSAS
jgi:hypothetical protein